MSSVLHIEASPKGERSASSKLAAFFLDAYCQAHPEDEVEKSNVFDAGLPPFAADAANARLAPIFGEAVSESQARIWDDVKAQIAHLDSFDKIVLSSADRRKKRFSTSGNSALRPIPGGTSAGADRRR